VLRHDKLVEVVRRAMRRGGVTSSTEPLLAALQPGPRIRLPRAEARGDILYVLINELQVGDVSVGGRVRCLLFVPCAFCTYW
jgi:hypothetical protein